MTRWDRYLIIFVIIVSLLGLYYVKNLTVNNDTRYILIKVNGKEYKKISMDSSLVGKTLDIRTEFGYNKIEIGENSVRVIEADCPDKLDVKQGWISNPNEVIVCLPNRLVVEIISEKENETEIDQISY